MAISKRISKFFIAGLMTLALLFNGCGYLEEPETFDYVTEGNEPLFKDSEYQSLYQIFGDITGNEARALVEDALNSLQAAELYGDITEKDAEIMFAAIKKAREIVVNIVNDEKSDDYEFPIVEILELMHENKIGDMLTNLIKTTAPADPNKNVFAENFYPILAYIMNLDFGDFEGIRLGILEDQKEPATEPAKNTISNEEISTLKSALENLVNPKGPYKAVYTQSKVLFDLVKDKEGVLANRPTVGDFKETVNRYMPLVKDIIGQLPEGKSELDAASIINAVKNALIAFLEMNNTEQGITPEFVTDMVTDLWFDVNPDSEINLKPVLEAILELWDAEKDALTEDSDKLLYALGRLMADTGRPGHDGWNWTNADGMTDMERILLCIQDILNPMVQDRSSLKNFLLNALEGTSLLEGADNIHGILQALSTVNIDDMKDIDTGLYKYMVQYNIEGDSRGEETDINMSVMRGLLYMLTAMYPIATADLGNLLDVLVTEGNQIEQNDTLLEWLLGLIIVGCYDYPSDYDFLPGYPNPLEGVDWVFYQQDIAFQIEVFNYPVTLMQFDGVYGLLGILLENDTLSKLAGVMAGGLTDPLPALIEFIGSDDGPETTGEKHKLFSILAPLLKHYWDEGRILDIVEMATYMNEIDSSTYKPLAWYPNNATFRQGTSLENRLGHVLENIEGRYGYGLMYYSLRGDSEADTDHSGDLLDPTLDMIVRVLNKLQNTPYGSGSLLDYISAAGGGSSGEVTDPAALIDNIFEPDASGECAIDKVYGFLVENHSLLAKFTRSYGDIMLALHADLNNPELEDIFDILANGEVKPALKSMIETVLMEVDEYGIVDATVMDALNTLLDTILYNAETLTNDIAVFMPDITKQLENLPAETDGASDGTDQIMDTIRAEIAKDDTDLIRNLKILGYRALRLYHSEYNDITNKYFPDTATKLNDDTPLFDALDVLVTGSDALYSMKPMMDFITAFIEQDMLSNFISKDEDSAVKKSASLRETQEADEKMVLRMRFLKALFTSYDGKDPVALMMLKPLKMDMEWENKDDTVMNALLKDLACLIRDISPQSRNSKYYKLVINLIDFSLTAVEK